MLLDAARHNGLMPDSIAEEHWDEARSRIDQSGNYEREADLLYNLMHNLESAGMFVGTWIEARWEAVKSRVDLNG